MPFAIAGGVAGCYSSGEQEQSIIGCTNSGTIVLVEDENDPIEISDEFCYGIAGEIAGAVQNSVVIEDNSSIGEIEVPEKFNDYIIESNTIAYYMLIGDDMILFDKK